MEKDNIKRAVNTLVHDHSNAIMLLVHINIGHAINAIKQENINEALLRLEKAKSLIKKGNERIDYFYELYKNDFQPK